MPSERRTALRAPSAASQSQSGREADRPGTDDDHAIFVTGHVKSALRKTSVVIVRAGGPSSSPRRWELGLFLPISRASFTGCPAFASHSRGMTAVEIGC